MTGFCSCKAGIPIIYGHNLSATQRCIQYRYTNLQSTWRCREGCCLYRLRAPTVGEDSTVIKKILDHLDHRTELAETTPNSARAPPTPGHRDGS